MMVQYMKNILLISYDFPPISGIRSIRWVQFVKYFVQCGYKVDVLTINPEPGYRNYDRSSLKSIPGQVNVYRTYPGPIHKFTYKHVPMEKAVINPRRDYKSLLRNLVKKVYKNTVLQMFIPDKMVEWLPWGLRAARKLARENQYDVVISSAPPFTDHILAYYFKKWTGILWIADYGDPWVFNPVFFKWRYPIDSRIEKKLVREMDHIIVTTDETAQGFIEHYPFLKQKKLKIISNGYDLGEFENAKLDKGSKFRIVYTGIFYDHIREPYVLFDAVKELKDIDFEVIIAGNILPHFIEAAKKIGLNDKVIFLGHQFHKRVLSLQKGADVLLLLLNKSEYQTPGKIFEYFGARRPILAIQMHKDDVTAELIKKHNRGIVVDNDSIEIASAIEKMFNFWKKEELKKQFNLETLEEYSWDRQADKLEKIIRRRIFYD